MTVPGTLTGNGATWTASGVNAPSSRRHADGSIYWGITMKKAGGGIFYCIWREAPLNTFQLVLNTSDSEHRGTLGIDGGQLVITIYTTSGDNSPSTRIIVPGFVAPSEAQAPPAPGGDGGALDPIDRKALDWLRRYLSPLLS